MFIDSHAHLADPAFDSDREAVIARAGAAGAAGIVCIGESIAAALRARELATRFEGFVAYTAGVHPHDAAAFEARRDLAAIRSLIDEGAVAVGECGLDYHYDHSPRDAQRRAFSAQIALAAELGRPVVVHTREAVDDTRTALRDAEAAGVRGVLHCFTGPPELADAAVEAGWFVSFSGIITFKRWTDDAVLRAVPADRVLVESDAPYLAPVPFRGRRNEPAYVTHTVARLARAREVDAAELAALVGRNARTLYGLASAP
ncbi:MAG TPA: TatD family hydrolase [Gemmatimonadaceae bacterium]|nr:TatD family hydrolase [Gemmatimonadaceae bacterium]